MKTKKNNQIILVSACLAGVNCRYDKKLKSDEKIIRLVVEGKAIPLCPEILGGLRTPRPATETINGDGKDVLNGKAKVKDKNGNDYTREFIAGAVKILKIAKILGIKKAILKSKSPSCGNNKIFDGTFSGNIIKGDGVLSALLKRHGIKIISNK